MHPSPRPRPVSLRVLACLAPALLLASACFAQDVARMGEIVKAHAAGDRFMGAVLVAKEGAILFEQGAGWANAEWKIPNTPATKFRLGSITKQFTAAAILLLAEDGKLDLDDPLSKFIPSAPESWRPVTIRQLLSHTGGVPGFTDSPDYRTWKLSPATVAENMARIASLPLEFTPGEKWKYSNMGYFLLGWIVELASGQSYEQFLRARIFSPLGMNDSGVDSNATILPQRAAGYSPRPGGYGNAPFIDMSIPAGAGALYSTVHDLQRWAEGLFGGKLLKPESLEKMTTPVKSDYAFGVFVSTAKGRKSISHSGGIEGFNTHLAYYPESKLTVIALANINGAPVGEIVDQLAALALGEKVTLAAERVAIDLPEATLQRYVGVYQLTPEVTNSVRLADGHLTTQLTGQDAFPIFAESEKKFFLKIVNAQVEFFADASGRITHLVQYQNGRETKAERISDTPGPVTAARARPLRLDFPGTEIARVAMMWERIYGGHVTVTERAQSHRVTFKIEAPTREEFRPKFIAALREAGIHVIERSDGIVFDTQPASGDGK